MKRPTLTTTTLVRISLTGVPADAVGHCPDDRGMVDRLSEELASGRLPHAAYLTSIGGGRYVGYWAVEDAPKIADFLRSLGAEEVGVSCHHLADSETPDRGLSAEPCGRCGRYYVDDGEPGTDGLYP